MWIYTTAGMVSIVAHRDEPELLLVRSRERATLEELFPAEQILETERADYPFRVIADRGDLSAAIAIEVESITYPNFKDAVQDPERHRAYFDVYHVTLQLDSRYKDSVEVEYDDPIGAADRALRDAEQDQGLKHYGEDLAGELL